MLSPNLCDVVEIADWVCLCATRRIWLLRVRCCCTTAAWVLEMPNRSAFKAVLARVKPEEPLRFVHGFRRLRYHRYLQFLRYHRCHRQVVLLVQ